MLGRWQAKAQTVDIADPHPNEVKDAAKDRRAAVAEVCFVDAGRPEGRQNESPPPCGWRAEGRTRDAKAELKKSIQFIGGAFSII